MSKFRTALLAMGASTLLGGCELLYYETGLGQPLLDPNVRTENELYNEAVYCGSNPGHVYLHSDAAAREAVAGSPQYFNAVRREHAACIEGTAISKTSNGKLFRLALDITQNAQGDSVGIRPTNVKVTDMFYAYNPYRVRREISGGAQYYPNSTTTSQISISKEEIR